MNMTNARDRFEAWAKDTMSLVKEPGGYKEATTHHAWRAWQAALTREQREGAPERKVGCEGSDGLLRVHAESETCDVCKPQQEAPGAVGVGSVSPQLNGETASPAMAQPETPSEREARGLGVVPLPPNAAVKPRSEAESA